MGWSNRRIAEHYSMNVRSVERMRKRLKDRGVDLSQPIAEGTEANPDERREKLKGKRFFITSAQNNTHVSKPFLDSIHQYCKAHGAQLIVSTFTYNKNGYQNLTEQSDDVWYDPSIRDYIYNQSAFMADDLVLCGELNILPTAVNPLSGLDNYTNTHSAIVPHSKIQLKSVPTPKYMDSRLLYSEGS